MGAEVRIGVAQYEPHVGDLEGNRVAAVRWARRAAAQGCHLVVLPELASSGYVFQSADEAGATAEDAHQGPYVTALAEVAAESGIHVASGLNERADGVRHNSSVLVGPSGTLAVYRKLHLFNDELSWFHPGSSLPVVDTPFGRVGMIVCFDLWFPEAARALAVAGAEIVAVPTNWVASFKKRVFNDAGECQGDIVAMATAAQNGVMVACADRVGEERGVRFLGCSLIVGPDGWPVAGPAPAHGEVLLTASVPRESVVAARQRTPRNHLLGDRRPGSYNAVVTRTPRTAPADSPAPT